MSLVGRIFVSPVAPKNAPGSGLSRAGKARTGDSMAAARKVSSGSIRRRS